MEARLFVAQCPLRIFCDAFPASAVGGASAARRPMRMTVACMSKPGKMESNPRSRLSRKVDDYNVAMKKMMMNPYEYHHELGMNYTKITENLIVGSQPQIPEDIDHLKEEMNVGFVINLQQDKDAEYWGIDLQAIIRRCQELGVMHIRRPMRDFDGDSLRKELPRAVSSLESAISDGNGRVYVHCTAGLGRAPAVAITHLFWFSNMDLDMAYDTLVSKRPCGPNKQAIRGATYDLAKESPWKEPFETLPEHAFSNVSNLERKLIQDRVRLLGDTC